MMRWRQQFGMLSVDKWISFVEVVFVLGGVLHEVPLLVEDGLDVVADAGQFAFVEGVGVDPALREDDVPA